MRLCDNGGSAARKYVIAICLYIHSFLPVRVGAQISKGPLAKGCKS
jgi:hypothetical protein